MLNLEEIRELIHLLDETSIAELRVETDDMKLHLKKAEALVQPVLQGSPHVQSSAPTVPVARTVVDDESSHSTAEENPVDDGTFQIITSPMVGTFYRAASPESPVYVELGSSVQEKSVVCIVEAMKLMNEIEAEVKGEVVDILAENGQLVEYGQPLFRIKLS